MKRGREAFWHDVALGGVVAAAVVFAYFLLAREARADELAVESLPALDEIPMHWTECRMPGCAIYSVPDVLNVGELYDKARQRVAELERQLADLKKANGCAKLEMTEPPRFVPKKEHES